MGFAPLAGVDTVKAAPVAGTLPSCEYNDCTTTWLEDWWNGLSDKTKNRLIIFALVLFFIIIPAILIYFVYCRKPKEHENQPQPGGYDPTQWEVEEPVTVIDQEDEASEEEPVQETDPVQDNNDE